MRQVVIALFAFSGAATGYSAHRDDVVDGETGILWEVWPETNDDAAAFVAKGKLLFEP